MMKTVESLYPVNNSQNGQRFITSEDLEDGKVVERLDCRVVPYNKIPEAELRNAFRIDDDRWIIPQSQGRRINHSCDPSCYISSKLDVVACCQIWKGEELTIGYNKVSISGYMNKDSVLPGPGSPPKLRLPVRRSGLPWPNRSLRG